MKVTPRLITLDIDGDSRAPEVAAAFITSTASSFRRFCVAAAERDYALVLTIAQDHATGTLWDLIWSMSNTRVTGTYKPYGNDVPSETHPHFNFGAIVAEPDGNFLGAVATASTSAVATLDVTWALTGKPTKVVA